LSTVSGTDSGSMESEATRPGIEENEKVGRMRFSRREWRRQQLQIEVRVGGAERGGRNGGTPGERLNATGRSCRKSKKREALRSKQS